MKLIVAGHGPFPLDMLRYDGCYPTTAAAAAAIGLDCENIRARDSRRVVQLESQCATLGRWASFGWTVLSHHPFGFPLPENDIEQNIECYLRPAPEPAPAPPTPPFRARVAASFEQAPEGERLYEVVTEDGERIASATNPVAVQLLVVTLNHDVMSWAKLVGSDAVIG